ncbi:YciI family protein [Azospirillum sp. ST 5-10]|uniref:YciI family protein n=1 Tax=unclassified Azospirillum TaxID=2630922 RepID=UPI003F4A061E
MHIVLLNVSDDRAKAGAFLDGHREWLRRGFDDGVFLLAGSLPGGRGGAILAHGLSLAELSERVNADPFVVERLVQPEILTITPSMTDPRLKALLA